MKPTHFAFLVYTYSPVAHLVCEIEDSDAELLVLSPARALMKAAYESGRKGLEIETLQPDFVTSHNVDNDVVDVVINEWQSITFVPYDIAYKAKLPELTGEQLYSVIKALHVDE